MANNPFFSIVPSKATAPTSNPKLIRKGLDLWMPPKAFRHPWHPPFRELEPTTPIKQIVPPPRDYPPPRYLPDQWSHGNPYRNPESPLQPPTLGLGYSSNPQGAPLELPLRYGPFREELPIELKLKILKCMIPPEVVIVEEDNYEVLRQPATILMTAPDGQRKFVSGWRELSEIDFDRRRGEGYTIAWCTSTVLRNRVQQNPKILRDLNKAGRVTRDLVKDRGYKHIFTGIDGAAAGFGSQTRPYPNLWNTGSYPHEPQGRRGIWFSHLHDTLLFRTFGSWDAFFGFSPYEGPFQADWLTEETRFYRERTYWLLQLRQIQTLALCGADLTQAVTEPLHQRYYLKARVMWILAFWDLKDVYMHISSTTADRQKKFNKIRRQIVRRWANEYQSRDPPLMQMIDDEEWTALLRRGTRREVPDWRYLMAFQAQAAAQKVPPTTPPPHTLAMPYRPYRRNRRPSSPMSPPTVVPRKREVIETTIASSPRAIRNKRRRVGDMGISKIKKSQKTKKGIEPPLDQAAKKLAPPAEEFAEARGQTEKEIRQAMLREQAESCAQDISDDEEVWALIRNEEAFTRAFQDQGLTRAQYSQDVNDFMESLPPEIEKLPEESGLDANLDSHQGTENQPESIPNKSSIDNPGVDDDPHATFVNRTSSHFESDGTQLGMIMEETDLLEESETDEVREPRRQVFWTTGG